jgi:hypothetical protein
MYDKNLETIQPLVQELYYSTFCDFGFGPWWPSQESDRTEISSASYWTNSYSYLSTYVQSFGSIALSWFSKMAAWRPYLKSDWTEIL